MYTLRNELLVTILEFSIEFNFDQEIISHFNLKNRLMAILLELMLRAYGLNPKKPRMLQLEIVIDFFVSHKQPRPHILNLASSIKSAYYLFNLLYHSID